MSIGIDLGTQSCRIAVWKDGLPVIVPDEEGNRAIPSYVAFSKEGRRFGSLAKAHQGANIGNTIYGVKLLLGRDLSNARVQKRVKSLPYKISSWAGPAVVEVDHLDRREKLALEEIAAMQISKLHRLVEGSKELKTPSPVIAVPPGFSRHQRQSVVDACEISGLPVPHLIDDTSAAALYYVFYSSPAPLQGKDSETVEKIFLVLDIGAGVTSASVVAIEDGIVEIKAASSNLDLGGGDLDEAIATHISNHLQSKGLIGSPVDPRTRVKIVSLAERARKELSAAKTTSIDLEAVSSNGHPSSMNITRDQVDLLCKSIYMDILRLVDDVVDKSGIPKSGVHEVLLVGGAVRTSAIVPAIQSCFSDKTPIYPIRNLDEAVALGSAIYGALKGQEGSITMTSTLERILLIDVIHTPLGLAILKERSGKSLTLPADGGSIHEYAFQVVAQQSTTIPSQKTIELAVAGGKDRTAHVQVYEGESKQLASNSFLGSFELHDVPTVPPGSRQPEVTVTFELNVDRSVAVSIMDANGRKRSMAITVGRLSKSDKETMKARAIAFNEHDLMHENLTRRWNEFEEYCYSARNAIDSLGESVEATLDWMGGAQVSQQSGIELEDRQNAILELVWEMLPPGFVISRGAGNAAPSPDRKQ